MTRHAQSSRRLLNVAALCEKLGMSKSTFHRRRRDLEMAGFPAPALEADQFGSTRWDEKAVDLWLDARIPAALRRHERGQLQIRGTEIIDPASLTLKLRERARELQL